MDLGLAFTFPTQDEKWLQKVGIAGLLGFVPFLGWLAVYGWSLEVTRRVIRSSTETLPDWSNFMDYLVLGLKGFVIGFVYSLPIIIVSIPYTIFTTVASDSEGIVSIAAICFSCVSILYSIVLALLMPVAMGILADTDDLGAAINPSKIFELFRAEPGSFIIAIIGVLVINFIASFGVILCVIGVVFTYAYALAVTGHLYGQAYNQATGTSMKVMQAEG